MENMPIEPDRVVEAVDKEDVPVVYQQAPVEASLPPSAAGSAQHDYIGNDHNGGEEAYVGNNDYGGDEYVDVIKRITKMMAMVMATLTRLFNYTSRVLTDRVSTRVTLAMLKLRMIAMMMPIKMMMLVFHDYLH